MTATARVLDDRSWRDADCVARIGLSDAKDDRLYFAQVREDPELELAALRPSATDPIVIVSSGGCTALSLLSAGAGRVWSVDVNRTQNHLVELKLAAVRVLARADALAFLGATPDPAPARLAAYAAVRSTLTPGAQAYWDARPAMIAGGVLAAGVTERLIRVLVRVMRAGVHTDARVRRMLACATLHEQRDVYAQEWNNRRWRAFFRVLLNRAVFSGTYDAAFFRHLERPSFGQHFRVRFERALTRVPVRDNYFLHHMLVGTYAVHAPRGVPPYLSGEGARATARGADGLTLVDGSLTAFLKTCPDRSVRGFALSNICEWLSRDEVEELFGEVARVAAHGARVCFRNFVGWTEVPRRWRHVIVEDRALGRPMIARDRSVVQRRFAVCRVVPAFRR